MAHAQLAPALAVVPGLESLGWLSNESAGRYGGFYLFEHKPAFDAFVSSELYDAVHTQRSTERSARPSTALRTGNAIDSRPA
jgi:hypothetical protein